MKRWCTERQMIGILRQAEALGSNQEIYRKNGITEHVLPLTIRSWQDAGFRRPAMASPLERDFVKKPRILLADDDDASLEILQKLLKPEFEIVASVGDGKELVKAAKALVPDLIVTDVTMPSLDGFQAARRVKALQPDARIVFFTMHADLAYVAEARKCGARGYVTKDRAHSDLLSAIRQALRNGAFFSSSLKD